MKCNYCGSEWSPAKTYSQIKNCPFCGKQLIVPAADESSLDSVIREILNRFGYELLLDKHKFISVLSDLAPKMKLERKVLTVALEQNIAHLFINTHVSRRELSVRQAIRELQTIMSEEAIYTVISSLILALNWDENLIDLLPNKQLPRSEVIETISLDLDNKNQSIQFISNAIKIEDLLEIQNITFFSNDGNMQHPTVDGDVFLQGHAQYIGIRVWIKTIQSDVDTELHWTIYKENGTAYSKEIILPLQFHHGDSCAYQSWGWADSGKWDVGKYKVVAYFKGQTTPYTKYFSVYPGYYVMFKKIKNVRLFAGGDVAPVQNVREYTNIYYASSLRRIYFEIELGKVKKSSYTLIRVKIYDSNNNLFANFLSPVQLEKGYDSCWGGWGWSEPFNWKKGRYMYEVSLYGSNIITGSFDVL